MVNISKSSSFLSLVAVIVGIGACGGQQQPPADAPAPGEMPAEPSPTESADAGTEGEHTMPDGGKMPGHHHEGATPSEGSDHPH